MYSRRDFGKAAMSGLALATLPLSELWAQGVVAVNSTVRGVKLGIIGNGLRGGAPGARPGGPSGPGAPGAAPAGPPPPPVPADVDQFIADLTTLGIGNVESTLNADGQPRL